MRIYYFSSYDLLRARTNQISDVRLCEGLAENGCSVRLIVPYCFRSSNLSRKQIYQAYGVASSFKITILPTLFWDNVPDWFRVPILFAFQFFYLIGIYLKGRAFLSSTIIMSRNALTLVPVILFRRLISTQRMSKVIYWAHEVIENRPLYRFVYKHADGIIATNSAIIDDLVQRFFIPRSKLAISLNPVPETWLKDGIGRKEARRRLGLPVEQPLVVYTGKLYIGQREAEFILNAAMQLPQCTFVLTGGKPNVVHHYQAWCVARGIKNVLFPGFLYDLAEVRLYQSAGDILVSYYTRYEHQVEYNYPQKITEYMLAKGIIITPDYPATRDILNETNAIFVEPENQAALDDTIRHAVLNLEQNRKFGQKAFLDVQEITFKKRAGVLIGFLESLSNEADNAKALGRSCGSKPLPNFADIK